MRRGAIRVFWRCNRSSVKSARSKQIWSTALQPPFDRGSCQNSPDSQDFFSAKFSVESVHSRIKRPSEIKYFMSNGFCGLQPCIDKHHRGKAGQLRTILTTKSINSLVGVMQKNCTCEVIAIGVLDDETALVRGV